jgi:hypothetical protein
VRNDVPTPKAATPRWKKVAFGVFVTLAVLLFVGALLYRFGSMWLPSTEKRAAYAQLQASGEVPALERRFHIPIPGCVCHSDSPVTAMQHSTRRISECMGCHGG